MQGMRLANETAQVESMLKRAMTLLTDVVPMDATSADAMSKAAMELRNAVNKVWDINASAVCDVNKYFHNRFSETKREEERKWVG